MLPDAKRGGNAGKKREKGKIWEGKQGKRNLVHAYTVLTSSLDVKGNTNAKLTSRISYKQIHNKFDKT